MDRLTLGLLIAMMLITGGTASGHGGGHGIPYNGPDGRVPPNMQGGGTVNPKPTGPTGPSSQPPPPPTTPQPRPAPTPGGASGVRGAGCTGSAPVGVTRNPRGGRGAGYEDWEFWWAYNKEPYLNLKENLHRNHFVSETSEYFLGRITRNRTRDVAHPSSSFIRAVLIPGLLETLKASHPDVRDSACIALGKVGSATEIKALERMLGDRTASVRKAAVIALGLLQVKEAVAPLKAILEADQVGVKLRGGRKPETSMRAVAATSLGLIGDSGSTEVREILLRYSTKTDINRTIQMNATVATGLLVGGKEYVERISQHLKKLATSFRVDDFVRAHAVCALGRLLDLNKTRVDMDTLKFLMRLVRRDRVNHVQRSAIISLGLLATDCEDHADARRLLQTEVMRGRNSASRSFAAISLGQVGGKAAFKTLHKVALGQKNQCGAYAALGLGILCDNLRRNRTNEGLRIRGLAALRSGFKKIKNPQLKGGYAIALGIARDRKAGRHLLDAMKNNQGITLRGYLAVALGMMEYSPSVEYLRDVLANADNLPRLKQQTAIGLGLMGNRDVATTLIKTLRGEPSTFVQASVTQALGYIGDRNSIGPLTEIMVSPKSKDLTRGFACVALGTIGEDKTVPVLSSLFVNLNFLATNRWLMELQRIM